MDANLHENGWRETDGPKATSGNMQNGSYAVGVGEWVYLYMDGDLRWGSDRA